MLPTFWRDVRLEGVIIQQVTIWIYMIVQISNRLPHLRNTESVGNHMLLKWTSSSCSIRSFSASLHNLLVFIIVSEANLLRRLWPSALWRTIILYVDIVTCLNVTIDGVWISNWIYWILNHTSRDYPLQITIVHRLAFSVTVFTALLGNLFQQWTFLCFHAHVLASWRPSHTNLLLF
jgi:hypothetical protein